MASEVSICNLALSNIGAKRIVTLDDSTNEARLCKQFYEADRDALLRDHDWSFATRYAALAVLSGVTPYGYTYAYQYPTDCLKAREIYRETPTADPIAFKKVAGSGLTNKEIWTDEEDAVLVYTAKITDTNMFDSIFVKSLSHLLAASLAMPLVKDAKLRDSVIAVQMSYVSKAINIDAKEGYENTRPASTDTFLEARA